MSDQVNILVRLHLPGARVGDVITVDKDRAERLVNAKYATYSDRKATGEYVEAPTVVDTARPSSPIVDLPQDSALKAEWEAVAQSIGIEVEDKTKAEIVEAVKAAVGS